MAEEFKEPFVNPYVDEQSDEARFSTFVSMDEAHERWKQGSWRPQKANFDLDPSLFENGRTLPAEESVKEGEKKNRFAFRLKEDIIDADQQSNRLDDTSYGNNYRPQGSLGSGISNITIQKLKYNALADIKEELPDDLSYLYGTGEGARERNTAKVKLHSYDRLATPVEKRRAQVEKMLPEERSETPEAIMKDIRRRRDIEDAKSGMENHTSRRKYKRGIYDTPTVPGSVEDFYSPEDQFDVETVTERGSWRSQIPVQDGLVPDSRSMPFFGRFSRNWSEIDSLDPSRSEMLKHTVNTIYDDEPDEQAQPAEGSRFRRAGGRREYYVSDMEFDPNDRYRTMNRQRRRISASKDVLSESIMSGEFNNPYVQTSNERLRSVINHDLRGPGHVTEPEGLTDPALMYEWNMGYSRVNSGENQYSQWLAEQSRMAEQAEQSRYRGSHRTGRPGAYMQREKPYGQARRYPRGDRQEHETRRRDMEEQMRRATEQGIADGREIIRLRQKARREAEQQKAREREEQRRRAYERQRRAYEQQVKAYQKQQQQYIRQQEEQIRRQQAAYGSPQAGGSPRTTPQAPQYGPMGYYTTQTTPDPSRTPSAGSRQSHLSPKGQNGYNQYGAPASRTGSAAPQPSGASRRGGRKGGR